MLGLIRRLFRGPVASAPTPQSTPVVAPAPAVSLYWLPDTRQPIPDWQRLAQDEDSEWSEPVRDAFWTAVADGWLRELAQALGGEYRVLASERFLLLTALPERDARDFLSFCEKARRRIMDNLGPLAHPVGGGKHVCLVFAEEDSYYDYIDHYYPDSGGEYAMSSGMFIQAGYGHFALSEIEMSAMQPVIAHELTHALLSHLPIPAWLNEGMAVNTEHAIFPRLADPRASGYSLEEIASKHAAFWNPQRIQEFWSGKSFLRSDDGNMLSYDLAKKMTLLIARDHEPFVRFALAASWEDGGAAAAAAALGYPVEHLIQAILGEGDWVPKPEVWEEIEHGGFRRAA